ncbi:cysteine desulfurase family protein [Aureliella helgolandensis]|uniref:cysteine desulfurase n=1 Tax=Aureliella helgolandensis TaxID=2527968 RepID=A0A518GDR2_9BACT|nr:cysteine desulfurase family protein [Aureliella helgolandensis]QDV26697.1 Cysteine desulfurase [Aureliella helgolandensis]
MIYLDYHATTPLAPEALEAMLPLMQELYANAGSTTHAAGRQVAELIERATVELAGLLGAADDELVFTSGATESNNLALFGTCLHPRQKRRKIVSVATEHKAVLDPLLRLERQGFEVVYVPVAQFDSLQPGVVDLGQLAEVVDEQTALVTIMLANNEIGTIQPLRAIADQCHRVGALLHTDATQALGRIPVDVDLLDVDLMSFSAHKFYGPKGVGGLYVRRKTRRVKLQPQIVGGGQQHNYRSGTINTAGIIGMHAALLGCYRLNAWSDGAESVGVVEWRRVAGLRQRLYDRLIQREPSLSLNGPGWPSEFGEAGELTRLPGNLNCCFYPIEGQSLMMDVPELAVSSGSACTSAEPGTSHVLRAIGLTEEQARSSLRFGIGRFNTEQDIELAADWLLASLEKLRRLI